MAGSLLAVLKAILWPRNFVVEPQKCFDRVTNSHSSVLSVNINAMQDISMSMLKRGEESNFILPLKMHSHPVYIKFLKLDLFFNRDLIMHEWKASKQEGFPQLLVPLQS